MGIQWDRFPVKSILNFPRILGMLESSRFFSGLLYTNPVLRISAWMDDHKPYTIFRPGPRHICSQHDWHFLRASIGHLGLQRTIMPFFDCFPVLPSSSWPLVLQFFGGRSSTWFASLFVALNMIVIPTIPNLSLSWLKHQDYTPCWMVESS